MSRRLARLAGVGAASALLVLGACGDRDGDAIVLVESREQTVIRIAERDVDQVLALRTSGPSPTRPCVEVASEAASDFACPTGTRAVEVVGDGGRTRHVVLEEQGPTWPLESVDWIVGLATGGLVAVGGLVTGSMVESKGRLRAVRSELLVMVAAWKVKQPTDAERAEVVGRAMTPGVLSREHRRDLRKAVAADGIVAASKKLTSMLGIDP